jgi:hypothetical protein
MFWCTGQIRPLNSPTESPGMPGLVIAPGHKAGL